MSYNLVEKQSVARFIGVKMSSGDTYFINICNCFLSLN